MKGQVNMWLIVAIVVALIMAILIFTGLLPKIFSLGTTNTGPIENLPKP